MACVKGTEFSLTMSMNDDRDRLRGLLALRTGCVERERLVRAIEASKRQPSDSLVEILVARGDLERDDQAMLESLVDRQIERHGGDIARSLAALATTEAFEDVNGLIDGDSGGGATLSLARGSTLSPSIADADAATVDAVGSAVAAPSPSDSKGAPRFRKLQAHAKGGLGEVHRARDEELGRTVALKEMRPEHRGNPALRSRFLFEAEINGNLEHPGIVPVYGLGRYPDGRPFYAMRFIEGESLEEAIGRSHLGASVGDPGFANLGLRRLLRRFVDICNAVAYAHSRGVLHRDLKPANVMLGPFGETLIIDWGLAKLLKAEGTGVEPSSDSTLATLSGSGLALTMAGRALGTPMYMSPEQAEGRHDEAGPATDIYSLGAILYAILAGRGPIQGSAVVEEVLERVRRGSIVPPRSIASGVPKPLEAVCLKALALEPGARYATAADLAAEIDRFLADEPVSAYRDPAAVRLLRWGRRHRTRLAASAATIAMTLVGLVVVLILQGRANQSLRSANIEVRRHWAEANRQRSRAESNFDKARHAVDDALTAISEEELLNAPGLQPLRRRLLERSLDYYRGFLEDSGDDPEVRFETAATFERIGDISAQIGTSDEAMAAYREAVEMLERLAAEAPDDPSPRRRLSTTLNAMGTTLVDTRRIDEALANYRRALEISEALAGEPRVRSSDRLHRAVVLRNIGAAEFRDGRIRDALESHAEANAILEGLLETEPGNPDYRRFLANNLSTMAQDAFVDGSMDEALGWLDRACQIYDELTRDHPDVATYAYDRGITLSNYGSFLRVDQQYEHAGEALEAALAALESLSRANPGVPSYRSGAAHAANLLCDVLLATDRSDEALAASERAAAILRGLVDDDPEMIDYRSNLSKSENNLGRILAQDGRDDEALGHFLEAVDLMEGITERSPVDWYNLACNRSLCIPLLRRGATPDGRALPSAEAMADRAMDAFRHAVASGMLPLEHLRRDPDLDPLRDREDFQAILMDLAFPDDPFAH